MSWDIHAHDGAVIVAMNSNPVNKMNPAFFDDLHEALDRIDRLYPGRPLIVTAQGQTFSAGEEFAYDLKMLERSVLLGKTTAGAANPAAQQRIDRHFGIAVPMGRVINPISGTNWEGVGVQPDVMAPECQAFQLSYVRALQAVLDRVPSPFAPGERERVAATLAGQQQVLRKLSHGRCSCHPHARPAKNS